MFVDGVQCERYDTLFTRRISEPKYLNVEMLQALDMWNDIDALLGHLGWLDYVQLRFPMYEKLIWEFFSFFTIDTAGEYNSGRCYIRFRLNYLTHEMNLA